MKKHIFKLISAFLVITCSTTVMTSCADKNPQSVLSNYSKGLFDLTTNTSSVKGTAFITKDGVVFDDSMRTPKINITGGIKFPLTDMGIVKFRIKNTSALKEINFSFITVEDSVWYNSKTVPLKLEKTDKYKDYTLDLSGQYGWMGNLSGISIFSEGIDEGSILIKSVKIQKGGDNYPENMRIGPEEIISTYEQRNPLGYGMGPDGGMGSWRNTDGSLNFVGQFEGKVQVFQGEPDNPFKKVKYSMEILNVDKATFGYASISQVIKDPASDLLVGITHLERHYEDKKYYTASLGISISNDNGATWTFLGECISHHLPIGYEKTVSRDIGNGAILIKDGYLYVYSIDMDMDHSTGLAVSRVLLTDLFSKANEFQVAEFKKFKAGKWNQPGMSGFYDNILPAGMYPNFQYIQYNTILKKYIMLMAQGQNNGDIIMLVSENMLDWKNAKQYFIACGTRGEQYPTMISLEQNSQTTSGDKFYIYYCSWNAFGDDGVYNWLKLWTSANYVRRVVTVKAK
ncbi:MAG: hypothetical protein ACYCYI_11645 [Saccharofermentanales bacterium]